MNDGKPLTAFSHYRKSSFIEEIKFLFSGKKLGEDTKEAYLLDRSTFSGYKQSNVLNNSFPMPPKKDGQQ